MPQKQLLLRHFFVERWSAVEETRRTGKERNENDSCNAVIS